MVNAVVDAGDGILVSAVITTGTQIVKRMMKKAASNETFIFLRESADEMEIFLMSGSNILKMICSYMDAEKYQQFGGERIGDSG